MRRRYGNSWARLAASLTLWAHARRPLLRWAVALSVAGLWLGCGLWGWLDAPVPLKDALYRTLAAVAVQDAFVEVTDWRLEVARYAGPAAPLVGLVFAYSGRLGRWAARAALHIGGARHVVIAGASPAALHLAHACRLRRDCVALIAPQLPPETELALAQAGVLVIAGDPEAPAALRAGRAPAASHVVALTGSEAQNLRTEAALQVALDQRRGRRRPISHIELRTLALLREARDLRAALERARKAVAPEARRRAAPRPLLDVRPFSLAEMAVRRLMISAAPRLLSHAEAAGHPRPHLVVIGFDATAQALAAWSLVCLISARFEAPRVTVLATDPALAEAQFDADYPEARRHALWRADIAFRRLDTERAVIGRELLDALEADRGPLTAIAVSSGAEEDNLRLALSLLRARGEDGPRAQTPVLLHEAAASEFTRLYADERLGAQGLSVFGQVQQVAAPELVLDGWLDRNAALCHEAYVAFVEGDAQAAHAHLARSARGGWEQLAETYRDANRAVADHAMIKLWDCGWRRAERAERGGGEVAMRPEEVEALAPIEHLRWSAERLMAGWRPGEVRDDRARIHPNLRPWSQLSETDRDKDRVMVRRAGELARYLYPRGLVRRLPEPVRETADAAV